MNAVENKTVLKSVDRFDKYYTIGEMIVYGAAVYGIDKMYEANDMIGVLYAFAIMCAFKFISDACRRT